MYVSDHVSEGANVSAARVSGCAKRAVKVARTDVKLTKMDSVAKAVGDRCVPAHGDVWCLPTRAV